MTTNAIQYSIQYVNMGTDELPQWAHQLIVANIDDKVFLCCKDSGSSASLSAYAKRKYPGAVRVAKIELDRSWL